MWAQGVQVEPLAASENWIWTRIFGDAKPAKDGILACDCKIRMVGKQELDPAKYPAFSVPLGSLS